MYSFIHSMNVIKWVINFTLIKLFKEYSFGLILLIFIYWFYLFIYLFVYVCSIDWWFIIM